MFRGILLTWHGKVFGVSGDGRNSVIFYILCSVRDGVGGIMARETQRSRLRLLFKSRPNAWISLREILDLRMAQFGARILELRREGMHIENKVKVINGQHHSCYKYIPCEEQKELFSNTPSIKKD